MAENHEYMTLCPHCELYVPSRTFRPHRKEFFNTSTNSWEKDPGLRDSSDNEMPYIEIDNSVPHSHINCHSESDSDSSEELLAQTSFQVLMSLEITLIHICLHWWMN